MNISQAKKEMLKINITLSFVIQSFETELKSLCDELNCKVEYYYDSDEDYGNFFFVEISKKVYQQIWKGVYDKTFYQATPYADVDNTYVKAQALSEAIDYLNKYYNELKGM